MIEPLDGKVHGTIVCNRCGYEVPANEFIVFRVHDQALVETLECYRDRCKILKAGELQLQGLDRLITKVKHWQVEHPERCKVVDVEPGEVRW